MAEYIEREAALSRQRWNGRLDEYVVFVRDIESIPAADVAPVRHGRWYFDNYKYDWTCSECGKTIDILTSASVWDKPNANYCPNCGAKMEESE